MENFGHLKLIPVEGFPLVRAGDDIGELIANCLRQMNATRTASAKNAGLRAEDILVVTHKIVSKAENCYVDLSQVRPSKRAVMLAQQTQKDPRVIEVILWDTLEVIRARPSALIVRHRLGFISANGGVDSSNVARSGPELVLRMPPDPDASACHIRRQLEEKMGISPAVVIMDSHGRPWREGTVGVGIGVAGIRPVQDLRGRPDLFGRNLQITTVGFVDQIASAASLVTGQAAEGVPVVIVRGLAYERDENASIGHILRPPATDLFSRPE